MFSTKKGTKEDKEKEARDKKEKKEKEEKEKREKKEREKEKKGKKNKDEDKEKKQSVELPRSPREKDSLTFSPVPKEFSSFSGGTYQKEVHINERGKDISLEGPNKEKALGGNRSTPFFLASHVTEAELKLMSSKALARQIAEEYTEVKVDSPQWRAKVFKPELYRDLGCVFLFAKEFNVGVERPTICLLSKRGGSQGPLAFIEAFLGTKLFTSPEVLQHKRPIHVIVENVRACIEPKVSLKDDEGGLFQEVFFTKLGALLHGNDSSGHSLKSPHVILYQSRYVMNVEFFVVSSYFLANNSEEGTDQLMTYARPPERTIIWFEPATDWERFHGDTILTVKKIDPKLSRTVFVYTHFRDRVYKFISAFEVNRFLSSPLTLPAANFFLTFIPSDLKIEGNLEEELYEAQQRDLSSLQMLRYDARYTNQIGALQLKKFLLVDVIWKNYKKQIPRMIEDLQNYEEQSADNALQLKQKKKILRDKVKLREMASGYLTSFLSDLIELVNGTCIGDPAANGFTMHEEKAYQDNGEWVDETGSPITSDNSSTAIPYFNCRVFGSQQFERLICEFQQVAQKTKSSPVNTQEIAVSYSPRMNILWAAIDIAGKKLKESFVPLIKYLHKRAYYIFSRLVEIGDHNSLLSSHLKKNTRAIETVNNSRYIRTPSLTPFHPSESRPQSKLDLLLDYNEWKNTQVYPFLSHKVREMYLEFLKYNKNACYQACLEEFYSTHTIYWDMVNFPSKTDMFQMASSDPHSSPERAIHQLTAQIFEELKGRITTNVVINLYNFMLNPIKLGHWEPITETISSWSDEYLDSLFEVDSHMKELEQEENGEKEKIQSRHEASLLLKKLNFSFSHMER